MIMCYNICDRDCSHSATLIDYKFFNFLECATYSVNILYSLTDHLPNFLLIASIHPFPLNKQSRELLSCYAIGGPAPQLHASFARHSLTRS